MIQIGIASVILSLVNLTLLVLVLKRFASIGKDAEGGSEQDELRALRQEVSRSEQEVRSEVRTSQKTITDMLVTSVSELSKTLTSQLEGTRNTIDDKFQKLQQSNDSKLERVDRTVTKQFQTTSDTLVNTVGELGKAQKAATDTLVATVGELGDAQSQRLEDVARSVNNLTQSNETSIENIRKSTDERIQSLQTSNENSLNQIRQTVTEQLQTTSDTLVNTVGELGKAQKAATDTLVKTVGELGDAQSQRLEDVARSVNDLTQSNEASIENIRKSTDGRIQSLQTSNENSLKQIRQTVIEHLQTTSDTLVNTVGELGKAQTDQLTNSTKAINELTQSNKTSIDDVRTMVDKRLQDMQTSNESKLDEMRKTVDEQLHSTLEKRLGESFNIVSKRLEEVQRGLGEMQSLATGVGDLKRVLTNVKARGTWGEVQLGTLLEDILTPDQYDKNVKLHENSHEEVEYAIRLPGNDDGADSCVWLPIDSKLPLADYERVVAATDAITEDKAIQALTRVVRLEAKKIQEKYIAPPKTTDFAIMFLPTEGLYAEVLRVPGLITELLQRYRIVVAGPTTLAAILNSLRMGFQTLAIEKHSSEVWEVLGAVKSEFGKFGGVMDKLKRQLNTAAKTVDETGVRTRAMERRLRTVEELPSEKASVQLGLPDGLPVIQQNGGDDYVVFTFS